MNGKSRQNLFVFAVVLFAGVGVQAIEPTVINFDDLDYDTTLSGTTYVGLRWEWGNKNEFGDTGEWYIPPEGYDSYPYSTPHYVINGWGVTLMGIGFSETVDVLGAYFSEAGNPTTGVRVHGYLDETQVAVTDWFTDIDTTPDWFAINLNGVDRIVIESIPIGDGHPSWYGMDDLTYVLVPEPATIMLLGLGGTFLCRRRIA